MVSLNGLLRNRYTRYVQRRARDFRHGRGWGGFHSDSIYRGVMLELLKAFPFTSFVETGTFFGYSTELIALRHPKLPVFTSEVVPATFQTAKLALSRYPNITQTLESSDRFVQRLLEDKQLGELPLFYLDAHWQDYWPLRAELGHIARAGIRAVSVIDDFKVPGRPEFGFDVDGGYRDAAHADGLHCDLIYVAPSLLAPNTYHALFPKYTASDAFGNLPRSKRSSWTDLRGHLVLFQNMPAEYEAFLARPFVRKYYFGQGELPATPAPAAPAAAAVQPSGA